MTFFTDLKSIWAGEESYNSIIFKEDSLYSVNEVKRENPFIFDHLQKLNLLDKNIVTIQSQQATVDDDDNYQEMRRFFVDFIGDDKIDLANIVKNVKYDCHYILITREGNVTSSKFSDGKIVLTKYRENNGPWVEYTTQRLKGIYKGYAKPIFDINTDIYFLMSIISKDFLNEDFTSQDIITKIIQSC